MSADPQPAGRSRGASVRLAVTLPEQLARAARAEAEAIGIPSLSAFIARAVEEKIERNRFQDALVEIFREQPITDEEKEWAERVLHRR